MSPGGLPPGITPDNVLWQQNPRNRRIAEVLGTVRLVERAGQGFDLIYRECIRQSKPLPGPSRTDDSLRLAHPCTGRSRTPSSCASSRRSARERLADLQHRRFPGGRSPSTERSRSPHPSKPRVRAPARIRAIIERLGRGRGTRHAPLPALLPPPRQAGRLHAQARARSRDQQSAAGQHMTD